MSVLILPAVHTPKLCTRRPRDMGTSRWAEDRVRAAARADVVLDGDVSALAAAKLHATPAPPGAAVNESGSRCFRGGAAGRLRAHLSPGHRRSTDEVRGIREETEVARPSLLAEEWLSEWPRLARGTRSACFVWPAPIPGFWCSPLLSCEEQRDLANCPLNAVCSKCRKSRGPLGRFYQRPPEVMLPRAHVAFATSIIATQNQTSTSAGASRSPRLGRAANASGELLIQANTQGSPIA